MDKRISALLMVFVTLETLHFFSFILDKRYASLIDSITIDHNTMDLTTFINLVVLTPGAPAPNPALQNGHRCREWSIYLSLGEVDGGASIALALFQPPRH